MNFVSFAIVLAAINLPTSEPTDYKTAFQRANQIYRDRLAKFEAPELAESVRLELEDYVDRRKGELKANV